MKKKQKEPAHDHLFSHMQSILPYHQLLLRDKSRNVPFAKALKRSVRPGSSVLDIGSGSGVWAIYAAKLGAARVAAIERDESMIPVILAHARENGVAERIEIFHGPSTDVRIRGRFDVVVSETIGNQAFDESIIQTMIDARRRFLKPGGIMIPQTVTLIAAPARLAHQSPEPLGVPVTAAYLDHLATNIHVRVSDKSTVDLLAPAAPLYEADLLTIESEPDFVRLRASWKLRALKRANSVVLWARTELAPGIQLDTWDTLNWSPIVCRFKPFEKAGGGVLDLSLSLNAQQYHWTVATDDETPRSYGPFFTYAKLKHDTQTGRPFVRKTRKKPPGV